MAVDVNVNNWDGLYDNLWNCQHQREDDRNTKSGLLAGLVGLLFIPKYVDKYKETQRRMRDVAIRQQNLALIMKDHYLDVTHKQIAFALDKAMTMPLPSLAVDLNSHQANVAPLVERATTQHQDLMRRYAVCTEVPCNNTHVIAAYGTQAIVDSAYADQQYRRRRFERRVQLKRGMVQKAHAATLQSPGNVFQLMEQAASIYSSLFQNAQQNLAGATSSLGYGLGTLGGVFSRGI